AVMPREEPRRRLAHLRDAERVDKAVERNAAALVDRGDELLGADRAPAFAADELLGLEAEDVAGLADEAVMPELGDVLGAEPLDVEAVAGDEMLQALDCLGRADEAAGAAPRDHALLAHGDAVADRATVGELVRLAALGAAVEHDRYDLRDHVAGALEDHGVALAHVLAGDFVFVVERRALDDHAADRDRFQDRDRGQGALAADLDADFLEDCLRPFGREFVRERPARGAADHAEPPLQFQVVDLVDDAVDVVGQFGSVLADLAVEIEDLGDPVAQSALVIDAKAPVAEVLERLFVGFGEGRARLAPGVSEEFERPARGDRRVELAQ